MSFADSLFSITFSQISGPTRLLKKRTLGSQSESGYRSNAQNRGGTGEQALKIGLCQRPKYVDFADIVHRGGQPSLCFTLDTALYR
jgi:hypothetical protein